MRFLAPGTLALAAILSIVYMHTGAARAQAPAVTYQYPQDGDVLAEPPVFLQMCFTHAVDVRDLHKGGDFSFDLVRPNNFGLGMRIVFQVNGFGVAIYPGIAEEGSIEGAWHLDYTVRNRDTLEELTDTINFTINAAEGVPVIRPTPFDCVPDSTPGENEPTAGGSATPNGTGLSEDDDGPDILLLALLTIGAAGIAAVIGLIGYAIRRRIGFSPHSPPEGGGDDHH